MQGGIVKDKRAFSTELLSNCWICEGWSQVQFIYEPGQSDENLSHDEFVPICLHLEIDDFKPDLLLPTEDNPKVFEVYRRLPPGNHRYFFTVGGEVKIAKDHRAVVNDGIKRPRRELLQIKSEFDIDEIIASDVTSERTLTIKPSKKKD